MDAPPPQPQTDPDYPPLSDYAAIGDCSVLALVSKSGSLDWLCLPRFSSPSVFAAILDAGRGGRFRVAPAWGEAPGQGVCVSDTPHIRVERRYLDKTAVLQTTFYTPDGVLRLTDLMPIYDRANKYAQINPTHEVLRRVECVEGEVDVQIHYAPRPDFARRPKKLQRRGNLGIFCDLGDGIMALRSDIDLQIDADQLSASGRQTLRAGEVRFVSMSYDWGEPAALVPLGEAADQRLARTVGWWRDWARRSEYRGDWPEAVARSAITLKLLAFPPSGAVVAAPTTSLPERPGGKFNWDYRYCWLRDASMVVRTLLELGYRRESEAFLGWLLDTTRLTRPRMQVMYGLYGEIDLDEHTIDTLQGYRQASPVRVGNGAHAQRQIGIYGEVVEAVFHAVQSGAKLNRAHIKMIVGLGEVVCQDWRLPDAGIWESRGAPSHHTHSKLMCWLTLDRLIRLHEAGHLKVPVQRFCQVRDEIARAIEVRGFNAQIHSYTGVFDGEMLDAALYLMVVYGYSGGTRDRLETTRQRLQQQLAARGPGARPSSGPARHLIYRFRQGYDACAGDRAPFGLCSFWNVSALARHGHLEQAETAFEALLGYANDVGLYGEKIDATTGAVLGNFPQAFTHVGLINAALTIAEQRGHIQTSTEPPDHGRGNLDADPTLTKSPPSSPAGARRSR